MGKGARKDQNGKAANERTKPMNTTRVKSTPNWPRNATKSVETRKRDVVIRLADWTRNKEEPAYDVEVYEHGVYDWNLSKTFVATRTPGGKAGARKAAIEHATKRLQELVK